MNIRYVYLALALVLVSCYTPTRNCKDYKTGSFTFEYEIDGVKNTGHFTRDEKYSVEYYENKIDSSTVRWINDCEFILKSLNNQSSIHFKILETTATNYTFEYTNASRDTKKKLIIKKGVATRNDL
ncbi:hypothetical protein MWU65_11710 [Cellulophaga sp. F20128]|uniref:hypothetical protein n=1 Tax=Cellulophaga sp. F20128 TaxID=2926413 RepID=UPI001FF11305|nr:hypothetical protein [Cellulophaga sp. F20128]MCK0157851.1 hypothetical protein [Cellulophaga sp. F20128]